MNGPSPQREGLFHALTRTATQPGNCKWRKTVHIERCMHRSTAVPLPTLLLSFVFACMVSVGAAQERTTMLREYVAVGIDDHQTEKVFREEMTSFAPDVLLSIDRSIGEVHIIAILPFDEAQFIEYAQFLGVALTERPEDE